jgi:hypothetical protein
VLINYGCIRLLCVVKISLFKQNIRNIRSYKNVRRIMNGVNLYYNTSEMRILMYIINK